MNAAAFICFFAEGFGFPRFFFAVLVDNAAKRSYTIKQFNIEISKNKIKGVFVCRKRTL